MCTLCERQTCRFTYQYFYQTEILSKFEEVIAKTIGRFTFCPDALVAVNPSYSGRRGLIAITTFFVSGLRGEIVFVS